MAAPLRVAITQSPDKYDWPLMQPVIYPGGIELRQVSDRVFMLIGLTEQQTKQKDFLLRQLKKNTPRGITRRLYKSYDVYPLEYQKGLYALIITNKMTYFKFAWHFYRGEIVYNRKFKRDFIRDSVDATVRRMEKKKPPSLIGIGTLVDKIKKKDRKEQKK